MGWWRRGSTSGVSTVEWSLWAQRLLRLESFATPNGLKLLALALLRWSESCPNLSTSELGWAGSSEAVVARAFGGPLFSQPIEFCVEYFHKTLAEDRRDGFHIDSKSLIHDNFHAHTLTPFPYSLLTILRHSICHVFPTVAAIWLEIYANQSWGLLIVRFEDLLGRGVRFALVLRRLAPMAKTVGSISYGTYYGHPLICYGHPPFCYGHPHLCYGHPSFVFS